MGAADKSNGDEKLQHLPGYPVDDLFESYESVLKIEHLDFRLKIATIKNGITKDQLSKFKEIIDLDWMSIGRLLNIASRTLHLKKGNEKFNQGVSDRIMTVAEVYSAGYMVYEDRKKFNNWMKRRNDYLAGQSPVEIMETQAGVEEVKKEIRRIAFGIS
jgi:putative toxin-antitoxin system antitoxin component (TIGR02293 family)